MTPLRTTVLAISALIAVTTSACSTPTAEGADATTVTVTDQWEREVEVPLGPSRVVILEWEGLISKTLSLLDEADTIVGADPNTLQPFRRTLIPELEDATNVGSPWSGLNYESVAALNPDVVFLEAWVGSEENREMHQEIIDRIEDLGIPVIAMMSPSNFDEPTLDRAWEIIDIVGAVYDRSEDTDAVVASIEEGIADVTSRVPALSEDDKPRVALFATTHYLMGEQSIQSFMLTDILGAINIAEGPGSFIPVSEEQLLALDPDVLVAIGHEGYLSADEIRSGANNGLNWANLQDLSALRHDRIAELGFDEWRPTLETPIALMKAAAVLYPESFADIDLEQYEVDFYIDVFGLNEDVARQAIADQKWVPEGA